MDFIYSQPFELVGVFWLSENEASKFSGKIIYSPESGIRLDLLELSPFHNQLTDIKTIKLIYGTVFGEKTFSITLIDTILSVRNLTIGGSGSQRVSGFSSILVINTYLASSKCMKLAFEFEDNYAHFFAMPMQKEQVFRKLSENDPIQLVNDQFLKFSYDTRYSSIFSESDIDNVIYSNNRDTIEEIKKAIAPILAKQKGFGLGKIIEQKYTTHIGTNSKEEVGIDELLSTANAWILLFKILIDTHIPILTSTIYLKANDGKNSNVRAYPCIISRYRSTLKGKEKMFPNLPINLSALGDSPNELKKISQIFIKWLEIYQNQDWDPILNIVERVYHNENLFDRSDFILLVVSIETLLDLLGFEHSESNPKTLVEKYRCDEWKTKATELWGHLPEQSEYGTIATKLRNVVSHPNKLRKDPKKKPYWDFSQDELNIHNSFILIYGLFIKAIILHISELQKQDISKYAISFIEERLLKPID